MMWLVAMLLAVVVALWPAESRLRTDPVRLGEQVRVDEADEVGEAVVVAVVGGRGQKEQVVGVGRQALGDLVALGLLRLVAPPT